MLSVEQFDLGETAARLLQQSRGRTIVITDGEDEVGAIVSKEYLDRLKQAAFARLDAISKAAEEEVAVQAARLGISQEELVQRLLQNDEE